MKRGVVIAFLLLTVQTASGQFYNRGQDPASLQWLQIETDRFKVIYPQGYDKESNYILNLLEYNYKNTANILPVSKLKIPVVVHNRLSGFNGSVVWAPKRMDLYPSFGRANNLPQDNLQQLVSHELTHAFEMSKLNSGLTKVGSIFLGESSAGVVSALLQKWYLEGQAVFEESRLSLSGRGRAPSFLKETKAISYLGNNSMPYSYDRMLLGSYKVKVPTYYNLGYDLVSYTALRYGQEIWQNVEEYTARRPFVITTISRSLKRDIGLSTKELFEETYNYLGEKWQREYEESSPITYPQLIAGNGEEYESYYSPVEIDGNRVVAIKVTLDRTPHIVIINLADTTEKKIHELGEMDGHTLSAAGDKIAWVETIRDPRWVHRSYSVIKLMDITTRKVKQLSRKSRYFSVALSPDAKTIVAVSSNENNDNTIVFIDSTNGAIVSEYPTPENIYLHRPQWSEDGKTITFISLNGNGEGIYQLSLANNYSLEWKTLIEENNIDLQSVAATKDGELFYISSLTGTENIFLFSSNDSIRRITNTILGTEDISVGNNRIWFTDYTPFGNKIVSIERADFGNFSTDRYDNYLIDNVINARHELMPDTTPINIVNYSAKPYRKLAHLFNIHSWLPLYVDIEDATSDFSSAFRNINLGATLFSQNLLGTVVSDLGYEYDGGHHNLHANMSFMGQYPVFKLSADYGITDIILNSGDRNRDSYKSTTLQLSGKISVPLTFNKNSYYTNIVPSVTFSYSDITIANFTGLKGSIYTLDSRFYINRYHFYSHRDIFPRWGQYIDFRYIIFPFNSPLTGNIFMFRAAHYFPGGLPSAGLRLRYMYDSQSSTLKIETSAKVRGMLSEPPSNKIHLFSADYAFPIFYPDWNLGSLLYINRLRANIFFDYGLGSLSKNEMVWNRNNSKGIELYGDIFLLRFSFPISIGVRTSWVNSQIKPTLEALFTISVN